MKSNFCSRPFNEIMIDVNGSIAVCCVMKSQKYDSINTYLDSNFLFDLKDAFIKNEKHKACTTCWNDESISAWSNRLNKSIDQNSNITDAHIKFSNKCNFKCRMCSAYLSSSIAIEDKIKNPVISAFSNKKIKRDFYKNILPNLEVLTMSGGEPLLSDDHLEFLQIASKLNPKLKLIYNSNLSNLSYKKYYLPDLWKKFESVKIIVSLDAIEEVGEYQRFGFKWDKSIKNIKEADNFIDYIHATVTIYTIFSLPKLINWCINNNIELRFFYVSQPFLNPVSLPRDIKIKIFNLFKNLENIPTKLQIEIKNSLLSPLLYNHDNYTKLNVKFKRHTQNLDNLRDQSFEKTVPELRDWYLNIKGE